MEVLTVLCFPSQTRAGENVTSQGKLKCSCAINIDYQYLWNNFIDLLKFLHGDIH